MLEILQNFELTNSQWVVLVLCGVMTGMAKTGVAGLGMVIIPIMAGLFDPKLSTGILLPMLIVGDIVAAKHYRKDVDWKALFRLVPWVAIGLGCGVYVGDKISADWFRYLIAIAIFVGLIPLFKKKKEAGDAQDSHVGKWWIAALFGIAAGFFTMVGNAAGALMSIYFLSMNVPKNSFIGTRAWFFFIVNLTKVPLHIFFWETINHKTLTLDFVLVPAIIVGGLIGIKIVKMIGEKKYRYFVIALIIVAALKLLF